MYGGGFVVVVGKLFDYIYKIENVELVMKGCFNLVKYIENIKIYGVNVVVVVNVFVIDIEVEFEVVRQVVFVVGVFDVVICIYFVYGGVGVVYILFRVFCFGYYL